MDSTQTHKILFTGAMGSGKTTAIKSISQIEPVSTDVANSPFAGASKATTTVGLDYGELMLNESERLYLYGTPGQERFSALWDILAQGAMGLVVLVDHSSPTAERDMSMFLDAFSKLIADTGAVIGLTHTDEALSVPFDRYYESLSQRSLVLPVLPTDARCQEDVLRLVDALLSMIEMRWSGAGAEFSREGVKTW